LGFVVAEVMAVLVMVIWFCRSEESS
jgi:hypothetical protein